MKCNKFSQCATTLNPTNNNNTKKRCQKKTCAKRKSKCAEEREKDYETEMFDKI